MPSYSNTIESERERDGERGRGRESKRHADRVVETHSFLTRFPGPMNSVAMTHIN